jgi:hypothetical protein
VPRFVHITAPFMCCQFFGITGPPYELVDDKVQALNFSRMLLSLRLDCALLIVWTCVLLVCLLVVKYDYWWRREQVHASERHSAARPAGQRAAPRLLMVPADTGRPVAIVVAALRTPLLLGPRARRRWRHVGFLRRLQASATHFFWSPRGPGGRSYSAALLRFCSSFFLSAARRPLCVASLLRCCCGRRLASTRNLARKRERSAGLSRFLDCFVLRFMYVLVVGVFSDHPITAVLSAGACLLWFEFNYGGIRIQAVLLNFVIWPIQTD